MEFPPEVIKMIMENLNKKQRYSISRVCMLWRYLATTFKYVSMNLEEFEKSIKPEICSQIIKRTIFSYGEDYNKLTYLNLRNNSIGKKCAQYLAKFLGFNSSLIYLDLS